MAAWLEELARELNALAGTDMLRQLRSAAPAGAGSGPAGQRVHPGIACDDMAATAGGGLMLTVGDPPRHLVNFAGNDYLGLAGDRRLSEAAIEAIRRWGTGSGASRLVTGHLPIHEQTERRFASFKHAEAALLLPTGYMANLAVLSALPGPADLLCLDKLNHASLIDAARASAAPMRTYPHGQLDRLERLLARHARTGRARAWIVTDSVFSMDGDVADLRAICEFAERFDAVVVVDEAHGTGVLGEGGRGLSELQGVDRWLAENGITISTASKALGGLGGLVTGPRVVIETLVNRARPFVYTTAVPPAQAAAIEAAVGVVEAEPHRRDRLDALARALRCKLADTGLCEALGPGQPHTPIIPLITGTAGRALALSHHLEQAGILAPAIRPPTVPPGAARIRLTLRSDMSDTHIEQLVTAVQQFAASHAAG